MTQRFILHPDSSRPGVMANLKAFIERLPDTKAWKVEIGQYRKPRSDNQNAALWAVAYPPLRDATGHTLDELHEMFCKSFFGTREIEFNGMTLDKPLRTTTTDENGKRDVVDKRTFADFYDHVQQKAAEIGVFVPDPDPMHGRAL